VVTTSGSVVLEVNAAGGTATDFAGNAVQASGLTASVAFGTLIGHFFSSRHFKLSLCLRQCRSDGDGDHAAQQQDGPDQRLAREVQRDLLGASPGESFQCRLPSCSRGVRSLQGIANSMFVVTGTAFTGVPSVSGSSLWKTVAVTTTSSGTVVSCSLLCRYVCASSCVFHVLFIPTQILSIDAASCGTCKDLAGNSVAASALSLTLHMDALAPSVARVALSRTQPALSNASPVTFNVSLSEPCTGVGTSLFSVASSTATAAVSSVTPVGSLVYLVSVTASGLGSVVLGVAAPAGVKDLAGNSLQASGLTAAMQFGASAFGGCALMS
jgi:hypothetical protein